MKEDNISSEEVTAPQQEISEEISEEEPEEGQAEEQAEEQVEEQAEEQAQEQEEGEELIPAPDFTLADQYGNVHSLSDYRGKTIFLNFWATWCPPCRAEMPYIQELYEEYSQMDDSDVVILAVAFPDYGKETDIEGIKSFLEENGYTYPVLMDEEATLLFQYYITAYPTTFLINPDGNVLGYIPGSMTKDIMMDVIESARPAK